MKHRWRIVGVWAAIVVFFSIIVVPLYLYALYTVPLADDFSMTGTIYKTWESTKSIWQTIWVGIRQTKYRYSNWSGEYICMFLQQFPFGIGSYKVYFLSAWTIISIFIFAIFYFFKVIFEKYIKMDKKSAAFLKVLILGYLTFFIPDIYDAFFWYTTAVSYTLAFSVKLLVLSFVFEYIFMKEKKEKNAVKWVFLCVLGFLMAAFECSFTQTTYILIVASFCVYALIRKEKVWHMLSFTVLSVLGWGVTLFAPGNMARQSEMYGESTRTVLVIWESLQRGVEHISNNFNIMLLLITLISIPFIWKGTVNSDKQFAVPGVFTILSIGIYSSQFAPWIFSRGTDAPNPYGGDSGYVLNVFWFTFVVMWFMNVTYWTGWFSKKISFCELHERHQINRICYFSVIACLSLFWSLNLEHVMNYQSLRLLWHIVNGNASCYYEKMIEREELLIRGSEELLVVEKLEMPIGTGGAGDITEDENNWVNKAVRDYYNLDVGVRTE